MGAQASLFKDQIPPNLQEYGIQTEDSDYRIHVGFAAKTVYVFPTEAGREAVKTYEHKHIPASYAKDRNVKDGRGPTARGFQVYPGHIEEIQEVKIPEDIYEAHTCSFRDRTSVKGKAAEEIVNAMIQRGLIRLPMVSATITDVDDQIRGQDVLATSRLSVQVKCDWYAGYVRRDGTMRGLYLQTHERNPLKQF